MCTSASGLGGASIYVCLSRRTWNEFWLRKTWYLWVCLFFQHGYFVLRTNVNAPSRMPPCARFACRREMFCGGCFWGFQSHPSLIGINPTVTHVDHFFPRQREERDVRFPHTEDSQKICVQLLDTAECGLRSFGKHQTHRKQDNISKYSAVRITLPRATSTERPTSLLYSAGVDDKSM